jgi:hypothetical protein
VRYLNGDHPDQLRRPRVLIDKERIFASGSNAFVTFDRQFVRLANRLRGVKVQTP